MIISMMVRITFWKDLLSLNCKDVPIVAYLEYLQQRLRILLTISCLEISMLNNLHTSTHIFTTALFPDPFRSKTKVKRTLAKEVDKLTGTSTVHKYTNGQYFNTQ